MRPWNMYPAKLALYKAILECPPDELRENEVEIGFQLAKDDDIQRMFDKAKREEAMKRVVDDLIEGGREIEDGREDRGSDKASWGDTGT